MNNELQTLDQAAEGHALAIHPLDIDTEQLKTALTRRSENRSALLNWIRAELVEGTDWGRIHTAGKNRCTFAAQYRGNECQNPAHWSKPNLFKPGAEKITGMLGLRAEFPALARYENMILEGKQIIHIVLRCLLIGPNGQVVAEGIGARSLVKDDGDINKAFKMAEKSGMIDAVLRVGGLSAIFTQDEEDREDSEHEHLGKASPGPTGPHQQTGKPTTQGAAPLPAQSQKGSQKEAEKPSEEDCAEVFALSLEAGVTAGRLSAWITVATKGRAATLQQLSAAELAIVKAKLIKKMNDKPKPGEGRTIEGNLIPTGYTAETSHGEDHLD